MALAPLSLLLASFSCSDRLDGVVSCLSWLLAVFGRLVCAAVIVVVLLGFNVTGFFVSYPLSSSSFVFFSLSFLKAASSPLAGRQGPR